MSDSTSAPTGAPQGAEPDGDVAVGPVSLDQVIETMAALGVTLERTDADMAGANLNGYTVTFATIGGTVLIVRADHHTEERVDAGNPAQFLACNHYNAMSHAGKATVVDRTEHLIVRLEEEIFLAAGLSPEQLRTRLRSAVDTVLLGQDTVGHIVSTII